MAKLLGVAVLGSRTCTPLFLALKASLIGWCVLSVWRVVFAPRMPDAESQTPSQVSLPVDQPRMMSTMASTSAGVKCLAKVGAQLSGHFTKQASVARLPHQGLVSLFSDGPTQVAEVVAIAQLDLRSVRH